MAQPAGEQPTDPWLLAVEAQRPAVEHLTATLTKLIAECGRVTAVGGMYEEVMKWVRQDPDTHAAVLVMAVLIRVENADGGGT